jgi:hypothetical protein
LIAGAVQDFASVIPEQESDDSRVSTAATPQSRLPKPGKAEYSGVHFLAG